MADDLTFVINPEGQSASFGLLLKSLEDIGRLLRDVDRAVYGAKSENQWLVSNLTSRRPDYHRSAHSEWLRGSGSGRRRSPCRNRRDGSAAPVLLGRGANAPPENETAVWRQKPGEVHRCLCERESDGDHRAGHLRESGPYPRCRVSQLGSFGRKRWKP